MRQDGKAVSHTLYDKQIFYSFDGYSQRRPFIFPTNINNWQKRLRAEPRMNMEIPSMIRKNGKNNLHALTIIH